MHAFSWPAPGMSGPIHEAADRTMPEHNALEKSGKNSKKTHEGRRREKVADHRSRCTAQVPLRQFTERPEEFALPGCAERIQSRSAQHRNEALRSKSKSPEKLQVRKTQFQTFHLAPRR